jgi:penicillin amidase
VRRLWWLLAAAGAALAAAAALLVASAFPRRSGSLALPGLAAPVEVSRDEHGVPSVRAENLPDLFFAQGFVTAQDRLWQMEFQRRIGRGTLSEVLGPRLVPTDRFLRTIGFRRAASRAWEAASPEVREEISSYVRGVNALLARTRTRPLEFRILRFEPGPFDEIDALTWPKLMAWDLGSRGGGLFDEIERSRLIARLGMLRTEQFLAPVRAEFPILSDGEWGGASSAPPAAAPGGALRGAIEAAARLWPLCSLGRGLGSNAEAVGSNSWVLSGSRTTTGRPILANDPHLALRAPSTWYLIDLRAPGFHVQGASLPGVPGIIIGRNDRVAWGLTNIGPDVQDLYIEKTRPSDPSSYEFGGALRKFDSRKEILRVRGGRDVVFEVRESVHGPVVSDVVRGAGELSSAVALRWTATDSAVEDRGSQAFYELMRAGDWHSFLHAVSLFVAPAQNFLYADRDGHIGYTASGVVPIRARASGLLPVSGRGDDEWTGFIPFDRLPRCLDPARGFLVTANNAVASESYPYALSRDWPEPYRARRITDLIAAHPKLSPADVAAMQQDRLSYQARQMLPILLSTRPRDTASARILAKLRDWNAAMDPGSAPAAMYAAWYTELSRLVGRRLSGIDAAVRTRFLVHLLTDPELTWWCDDPATPAVESCEEFRTESLARAAALLEHRLGDDPSAWRWDRLHRARFPHGVFDRVPVLKAIFSLTCPAGGDASTVNVGAYSRDGGFTMSEGPSYRQVIDLARPETSLYVHTTGQSGNVLDSRYRDFLPMWRDGKYFSIGKPEAVLRLVPE